MSTELESERQLVAYLHGWKVGALGSVGDQGQGRKAKELAVAWGMVKFSARLDPMREASGKP